MTKSSILLRYRFALRFLAVFLFFEAFFGTFFPSALASERPMAIACLRLLTLRPDRPLFNVPALRFFIARPTLADAFLEYLRAMIISRLRENNLRKERWFVWGIASRSASDLFGPWDESRISADALSAAGRHAESYPTTRMAPVERND
jgi:hypothetical protein